MPSLIETIELRVAEIDNELDVIVKRAEKEKRNVTDEENTHVETLLEERKGSKRHLKNAQAIAASRSKQTASVAKIAKPEKAVASFETETHTELRSDPYGAGREHSYWMDLRAAGKNDSAASERLAVSDKYRDAQLATRGEDSRGFESRGETTVTGAGGEFNPPLWAIDQWIKLARPARTFADVVQNLPLPPGVSSINLPKVMTGTATATQTTQNTGVNVLDMTTGSVSDSVHTVAGGAVYSLQWAAQSPILVDQVITDDIGRDLATKVNAAVIAAVAGVSGLNSVTYTNASPTTALLGQYLQQGIDLITGGNYSKPDAILLRGDRWGRILSYTDAQGRPLVIPNPNYGPYNVQGSSVGQNVQGYAGEYRGMPVYIDPMIPNNLGAGSNQDEVFIIDSQQIKLWESAPKVESFDATYANQMSLFIRIYEYYMLIPNRLPKAISLITGTGMIPGAYGL